jgi:trimethylamine---corrinoid protein Co-methyltransferase
MLLRFPEIEYSAGRIHSTSLSLLEDPGIRIEHEAILNLLLTNGAKPGLNSAVVKLPRKMVEECVALCPRRFALTDRRGHGRFLAAGEPPVFWSVPGMALYRKGQHRPFTSSDMADMARLLEQLENVHAIFGMAMDDIPPPARDVVGLKIMAENSSKHIRVLCFSPEGADVLLEMKQVVGKHPWFSIGFTAHGPLRWTHLALEIFRRTAGAGIPVTVNGEPMAGVSGPVTLAGTAAVGNAEILAGVVINQLLEPGRPCIYNLGLAHVFDMKTAIAVTGAPENALLAQISSAMGRFYSLPSASWVSTESMCPDSQAALEKMFGFYTHMAGGVTNIWGVGQLESELTISTAQAVIDNEMISFAERFGRGVQFNDESLAVETIRAVGNAGSFLDTAHTLENYRSEFFFPSLLCRVRRAAWAAEGQKRLDQKAEEVADRLIANAVPNYLTSEQIRELGTITSRFIASLSDA